MAWNYYDIMTTDEFDELGVVTYDVEVDLEEIGPVTITVTKGNHYGLIYDGNFCAALINGIEAREQNGICCYINEDDMIQLGVNDE
jgi:hypothetical protein